MRLRIRLIEAKEGWAEEGFSGPSLGGMPGIVPTWTYALTMSLWLALRAAFGCANWLSCRFVTACPENISSVQTELHA